MKNEKCINEIKSNLFHKNSHTIFKKNLTSIISLIN